SRDDPQRARPGLPLRRQARSRGWRRGATAGVGWPEHPAAGGRTFRSPGGREAEMGRLRIALEGALEGHGAVVLLGGEPGIGKTRAAEELMNTARANG